MSILARIFGSSSVIKQAADGIYNGVDKAWYTDEEKSAGFLDLLKSYEPFKLTQRLLAISVTVPFVFIWVICSLMLTASGFMSGADAKALEETARTLGEINQNTLGTPVALVLAFYFGGGMLEGVVRAKSAR